jgi:hypothetical protein
MPAKSGIQYAVKPEIERKWRGILDHPLSRMMTSVQDAAPRRGAKKASVEGRVRNKRVAREKGATKNA